MASEINRTHRTSTPVAVEEKPFLQAVDEHVFSLSTGFFKNLQSIGSHFSYFYDSTTQAAYGSFIKNEAFGEDLVFTTGNHGKKEDIPLYQEKFHESEFLGHAKKWGFEIKQPICLKPYGLYGGCAGAGMYFCKDWLDKKDFNTLASLYKEGIPYKAIALHACYKALPDEYSLNRCHLPLYNHLKSMFSLYYGENKIGIEEKLIALKTKGHEEPYLSASKECTWILGATEKFFSEAGDVNKYLTFVKDVLEKEHQYQLEAGILYNALMIVSMAHGAEQPDIPNEQMIKAVTIRQVEAMCDFLGLDVATKFYADAPSEILESKPSTWSEGAYYFSTPMYNSKGDYDGSHAFVFIKASDSVFYLYDPNRGGKRIVNPEDTLSKQFKHYCESALSEKMTLDTEASDFNPGQFQVYQLLTGS